jgi:GntR family transcriptional regulator/MocR family aminotransferase
VSTITVEHAYDLLREEGYIESRERSGYFVVFCSEDGFIPVPQKTYDIFTQQASTQKNDDELVAKFSCDPSEYHYEKYEVQQ